MKIIPRIRSLAAASLLIVAVTAGAQAPKQVNLNVAFAAGGGTDITARLLADKLRAGSGINVVVENRTGAGGSIATNYVARTPGDGTNWLIHTGGVVLTPLVSKTPQYDLLKQLRPVARITSVPMVVYVRGDAPYKNLKELLQSGGDKGVSYASSGIGALNHVGGAWLTSLAGVKSVHVPFRSGAAAGQAVAAGDVDFSMEPISSIKALLDAGKLKALATTSKTNAPEFKGMASAAEQGYPEFDVSSWAGIYVAASTPDNVMAGIEKSLKDALEDPELQDRIRKSGNEVRYLNAKDTRALVEREQKFFGKIIRDNNIVTD